MKKKKNIWAWIFSIFFLLSIRTYFPSVSSVLFGIAGIMLLPIDFIQNKIKFYMNKTVKKIVLIICILLAFMLAPSVKSSETSSDESNVSVKQNENNVESTTEKETEVHYHRNKEINSLITAYNEIATHSITPDMVKEKAYDYEARVRCNNILIDIYATSENGLFVDYQDESNSDESIEVVFKDFCKTIVSEITDEELETAWKELQTEKYDNPNNNNLNVHGIDCSYWSVTLNNGTKRFFVKTNYTGN